MNTLHPLSQSLASQGRYGDSTLVHMNPQEVSGLQALARSHGTTLTTNPQTGLPEAFNLKSLLPAVIGAGLTIGSGGALSPLAAGMITGAGYGLATGDPMKGVTAGLGAYGGAGMGSGFSAAGAASGAPGAAGNIATQQAAMGNLGAGQSFYGAELAGQLNPAQLAAGQSTGMFGSAGMGQNFSQAGTGLANMFGTDAAGTAARSGFMGSPAVAADAAKGIAASPATGVGGGMGLAKYGGSLAASSMMGGEGGMESRPSFMRPYDLDITNVSGSYDPFESSAEREQLRYDFRPRDAVRVAQGGAIRYQEGGLAAMMRPEEAMTPPMDGRFLRGNGDGMSDEIPATIEGEQDALLSDGEFVIPADIVSHLGNGSSEAGAKILYQMMDRVRKARTGQKEQAEEIDVEEFLPA